MKEARKAKQGGQKTKNRGKKTRMVGKEEEKKSGGFFTRCN
jgi:hypothetical protein